MLLLKQLGSGNMKRILLINGSPRKNGNTEKILLLFREAFEKMLDLQSDISSLSQYDINMCKGCRACFQVSEEKCPCKDEVLALKNKMLSYDGIVIGSPVYVEDVTGLMKQWIDRMAFACHRPFLDGKPIYVFTTSGARASRHAIETMKNAFVAFGGIIIGANNFSAGALADESMLREKYWNSVKNKANRLKSYMEKEQITIHSLIAFRMQKAYRLKQKESNNQVDYRYWKEHGWLEKHSVYYHPVKIGFLKKNVVELLCHIIGLLL